MPNRWRSVGAVFNTTCTDRATTTDTGMTVATTTDIGIAVITTTVMGTARAMTTGTTIDTTTDMAIGTMVACTHQAEQCIMAMGTDRTEGTAAELTGAAEMGGAQVGNTIGTPYRHYGTR